MKHKLTITIILLALFLLAQYLGLAILHNYIDPAKSREEGKTVFKDLPIGERPPLEEKTSYISIMLTILIGTAILFILFKYNLHWIWKAWFLLAVVLSLTISFSAFVTVLPAFLLALLLGFWKILRPNIIIHSFTELFVYGGLAVIFVPVLNLLSMSILLVLIAGYDAYAVWKSKHMITLAKAQTEQKLFAGLIIPYKMPSLVRKASKVPTQKVRTAVLGGGDIGFPLLFAGVILKEMGLWQSLIIPLFALLGLGYLLWRGEEKKFYPAMPFIGAGCFLGWCKSAHPDKHFPDLKNTSFKNRPDLAFLLL